MENILEMNQPKMGSNEIEIDVKKDVTLDKNRSDFQSIITSTIDRGADYIIKSMPIPDNIKDILIDVKQAFKTKDFKEVVKVAVNSSIREGLEMLSFPKNVISDITRIKDVAIKGGLAPALSTAIDIVTKKYLKGNLFMNFISKFIRDVKDFVLSKAFSNKIDQGVGTILHRSDRYLNLCDKWYEAYEKFDVTSMNAIAKALNGKKKDVMNQSDCVTQNHIIQNMTQLINAKKEKLSQMQLQICTEI